MPSSRLRSGSAPAGDGGVWWVSEGGPDRVQVLNDHPIGSGKGGESHYLKAERRDEHAQQGGQAWIKLSAQDAGDTTNGI